MLLAEDRDSLEVGLGYKGLGSRLVDRRSAGIVLECALSKIGNIRKFLCRCTIVVYSTISGINGSS